MKSLAYCVDAVLDAAEEEKEAAAGAGPVAGAARYRAPDASFSSEEVKRYFARNIERLARAAEELKAAPARTCHASSRGLRQAAAPTYAARFTRTN